MKQTSHPMPLADDEYARLVDPVAELCRAAGALIMMHYNAGCAATAKLDGSMVTEADHAAEAVISSALHALTPGTPVIAEEAVTLHGAPACAEGLFWLVDPLDGTREFMAGNGEFTVNVALVANGRPVLGVVFAPALGTLYAGACGVGAWRSVDGSRTPIRVRPAPSAGLTVVGSRSHGNNAAMTDYLAHRQVAEFKAAGSSLKFCLLAAGDADLYPRFGRTMEWDTAAGQAVLEAAGGRVTRVDGEPLQYGKPGFENPHFIADTRRRYPATLRTSATPAPLPATRSTPLADDACSQTVESMKEVLVNFGGLREDFVPTTGKRTTL